MPVELKVPAVGESITEVQIAKWLKQEGEHVELDENICEIETDKATVELPAPVSGVISKLLKSGGENANVGEVIGYIEEGATAAAEAAPAAPAAPKSEPEAAPKASSPEKKSGGKVGDAEAAARAQAQQVIRTSAPRSHRRAPRPPLRPFRRQALASPSRNKHSYLPSRRFIQVPSRPRVVLAKKNRYR